MERLRSISNLVVSQQKEWSEILSGFETKNKYVVSDTSGNRMYLAVEEAGSTLLRLFLRALRPFTLVVLTESNQVVLRVIRPFRFYFHRAEIVDSQGRSLGVIQKRFSLLRRTYSVLNSSGEEVFQLFGPILHPWTFNLHLKMKILIAEDSQFLQKMNEQLMNIWDYEFDIVSKGH